MTEQFKAATLRALYGAILTAAATGVAALQQNVDDRGAVLITASTFLTYMIARGAAEGLIDSNRKPTSADVGQPQS
jgi:hypothetical protein